MSKPTKYYSELQENRIADYLKWHTVVGSGATATKPGDIFSDQWLGECKTHTKKSDKIVFKLSHWRKIKKEAQSKFKYPILFTDNGTQNIHDTWCLFDCKLNCPQNANLIYTTTKCNESSLTFNLTSLNAVYNSVGDLPCKIIQIEFDDSTLGIMPLTEFQTYFCEW